MKRKQSNSMKRKEKKDAIVTSMVTLDFAGYNYSKNNSYLNFYIEINN